MPPDPTLSQALASTIAFTLLDQVDTNDIIALHNHPRVLAHMPLASGPFGPEECARWVAAKMQQWTTHGFGPWAILIDGQFAGWGGFQFEDGDADLALVLLPRYWGMGATIVRRMITTGTDTLALPRVTALLPMSRTRLHGMARMGFVAAGERCIDGQTFRRFTLERSP